MSGTVALFALRLPRPPCAPSPPYRQVSDDGARDYRLVVTRYYEREPGLAMGRYKSRRAGGGKGAHQEPLALQMQQRLPAGCGVVPFMRTG